MAVKTEGFDKIYCYPKSNVLKNKLGIKDASTLQEAERAISGSRLIHLEKTPIKGNLDLNHLQKIHKYILGDVYEWAGKIRTVDIAKSNLFCRVQNINPMAEQIFSELKKENYLIGTTESKIPSRLSYYFGEINALHPFREGNGRTQREFIKSVAAVAGYELDFSKVAPAAMMEASIDTFSLEYGKMEKIIQNASRRISYQEQLNQYKKIVPQNGNLDKVAKGYFQYINKIADNVSETGYKPTNDIIRKMEKIHQVARNKDMTVKEVYNILKDNMKSENEHTPLMESIHDLKKELVQQETQRAVQVEPPQAEI